jgi:hypothetical protein
MIAKLVRTIIAHDCRSTQLLNRLFASCAAERSLNEQFVQEKQLRERIEAQLKEARVVCSVLYHD